MRFACWITKVTDTLRICNNYCFCRQHWLCERTSLLHIYVNCLSFWFLFWKTENPPYLTFLYLYARVLMTDLFLSGSSPQQQWSRTTTGRDSRTQGKAGREGEMPGGDSKGPRQFMVCLTILQLLLYSDTYFLLFDHCMIWSRAYVVTTDVLMVTGNYGFFIMNKNKFKH
jgi:hypothetical protein